MRGASDEDYDLDDDAHRYLKLSPSQKRKRNRARRRRKKEIKRAAKLDRFYLELNARQRNRVRRRRKKAMKRADALDRPIKLNAAQKRQINRDRRRRKKGIKRTTAMDRKERLRKHNQAINRKNPRADPYQPRQGDDLYLIHRERARARACRNNPGGWACGWRAADWDPIEGNWDRDYKHNRHYTGWYNDNLWDDYP